MSVLEINTWGKVGKKVRLDREMIQTMMQASSLLMDYTGRSFGWEWPFRVTLSRLRWPRLLQNWLWPPGEEEKPLSKMALSSGEGPSWRTLQLQASADSTPGSWSNNSPLERDLGSTSSVHRSVLVIITDTSAALICCKHCFNVSSCLPVVVVRKGCGPDERGRVLNDDVEKDPKTAGETVEGSSSVFHRGWVGKESKVARKSLANGLGKYGKLLIHSQTNVNKVAHSSLWEWMKRSQDHASSLSYGCSVQPGHEVMER